MTAMSPFAKTVYLQKYSLDGKETWPETAQRVAENVLGALGYGPTSPEVRTVAHYITERKFLPGGRYLYAAGREFHQVNNCMLLRAEDSREGWGDLWQKAGVALMTGAGIGVDYSDIRASGSPILKTGGQATGPISLMHTVNEIGRQVMQGGSRRSAIWAGLRWNHPDIETFLRCKDWPQWLREEKSKDFSVAAPMELTNVSVQLNDGFFDAYHTPGHAQHDLAQRVYWTTIDKMLTTGEPGFSVDTGENRHETLRNACTELSSADDSDVCNLGSINLARVESLEEMQLLVECATLFLLAGTVYSDVPYPKVAEVREQNRRLGLGVMGVHEWLLQRGLRYGPDGELARWLEVYAGSTEWAHRHADEHSLSRPVKTRAIAPTGTIGIIGETTTGIEPIFCVAFKRRYLHGSEWRYQYVVDPTARRIVELTEDDPNLIEDAYSLSLDVERRVEFQAWTQQYVDHGISSTINLPAVSPNGDSRDVRAFGDMLIRYLPKLRGVTVYPEGARSGAPLSPASYSEAITHEGTVFEESEERCVGGACGV